MTQDVEKQRSVSVEQLHHWASGYVVYIIIRVRTNIYPIQPAISLKSNLTHLHTHFIFSLSSLHSLMTQLLSLSLLVKLKEDHDGYHCGLKINTMSFYLI